MATIITVKDTKPSDRKYPIGGGSGNGGTGKVVLPADRKYPKPTSYNGKPIIYDNGIMTTTGGGIIGTYSTEKSSQNATSSGIVSAISQGLNQQQIKDQPIASSTGGGVILGSGQRVGDTPQVSNKPKYELAEPLANVQLNYALGRAKRDTAVKNNDFGTASTIPTTSTVSLFDTANNQPVVGTFNNGLGLTTQFGSNDIRSTGSDIGRAQSYRNINTDLAVDFGNTIKSDLQNIGSSGLSVASGNYRPLVGGVNSVNNLNFRFTQLTADTLYKNTGYSSILVGQGIKSIPTSYNGQQLLNKDGFFSLSGVGSLIEGQGENYLYNTRGAQQEDVISYGVGLGIGYLGGKAITTVAKVGEYGTGVSLAKVGQVGGGGVLAYLGYKDLRNTYYGAGGGEQGIKAIGSKGSGIVLGGFGFAQGYGIAVPKSSISINFDNVKTRTSPTVSTDLGFTSKSYGEVPIKVSEFGRTFETTGKLNSKSGGSVLGGNKYLDTVGKGDAITGYKLQYDSSFTYPKVRGSSFLKGKTVYGDTFTGVGESSSSGFIGIVKNTEGTRVLSLQSSKPIVNGEVLNSNVNIIELTKSPNSGALSVTREGFGSVQSDVQSGFDVFRTGKVDKDFTLGRTPYALGKRDVITSDISIFSRSTGGTSTPFERQFSLGRQRNVISKTYTPENFKDTVVTNRFSESRFEKGSALLRSKRGQMSVGFGDTGTGGYGDSLGTGGTGFDSVFKPSEFGKAGFSPSSSSMPNDVFSPNRPLVTDIGGYGMQDINAFTGRNAFGVVVMPKYGLGTKTGGITTGISGSISGSGAVSPYTSLFDVGTGVGSGSVSTSVADTFSGAKSDVGTNTGADVLSFGNNDTGFFDIPPSSPYPDTPIPSSPFFGLGGGDGGVGLPSLGRRSKSFKSVSKAYTGGFGLGQKFNVNITKGIGISSNFKFSTGKITIR